MCLKVCGSQEKRTASTLRVVPDELHQFWKKYFPSVLGVDVSETMLEQARKNCSQASFLQQDITLHPLESSFDVITAFRFFLNAQPELRRSALVAMHNVLRDDGRIILNIHVNRSSILGMAYRLRNRLKGEVVAHTCSYEEIEEYLNEAGFAIEDEFWYSYLPRTGWRLNRRIQSHDAPVRKVFQGGTVYT